MTPLLTIHDLGAGYGESEVLRDVSLEVGEREIVCLLGPNGAGKTTLMRTITGLIRARGGTVRLDGADITGLPAHKRVEAGIALSPEGRQVFPNLSVRDNLLLGSFSHRARPRRKQTLDHVLTLFPRLAERMRQHAGLMSGGEQQMLAIARALMAAPRLLLLDEPSLGLSPKLVGMVLDSVATIAASGTSILLVEQNVHAALSIASRGYVLADGRIVMSDHADALLGSELVQDAFLHRGSRDVRPAPSYA